MYKATPHKTLEDLHKVLGPEFVKQGQVLRELEEEIIMTLKDKFKERLYKESHDDSECLRIKFENIDKVIDLQEQIADDFAIGFAEWFWYHGRKYWRGERTDYLDMSEILEIYKKEKKDEQ
jgi:hypothetical protein